MGKLFNLKEWLTVADAARHLTIVFGEDVTEADVLRLALDRRLKLSVHFVNGVEARLGKVVPMSEAFPENGERLTLLEQITRTDIVHFHGFEISATDAIDLGDHNLDEISGVWDLIITLAGESSIERRYQKLTSGVTVYIRESYGDLNGILVTRQSGETYQLQEAPPAYPEFPEFPDSNADPQEWRRFEAAVQEHPALLAEYDKLLKAHYAPLTELPDDAILVVRTDALRELEESLNPTSARPSKPTETTDRSHVSDKLATLNHAAARYWGANVDREDRGTHPKNTAVAEWLIKRGYSESLAEKAASIIRPEWAPTGRKPEE